MDMNSQIRESVRFLEGLEGGTLSTGDAFIILDQLDDVLINLMFNYFRKKAARDPDQYSGLTQRLYDLSSTYPELVTRMNNGAKDPIVEWFMETYSFNAFYNDPEEMATIIVEKLES